MSTTSDDPSGTKAPNATTAQLPWFANIVALLVLVLTLKNTILDAIAAAFPSAGQHIQLFFAPLVMALVFAGVAVQNCRTARFPAWATAVSLFVAAVILSGALLGEYSTLKASASDKLVFDIETTREDDCHKDESAFRLFLLTATDSDFVIRACPPSQLSSTISGFRRSTNQVYERGPSDNDSSCQELLVKSPLVQFQTTVCGKWKTNEKPIVTFLDDQHRNKKGFLKKDLPCLERLVLPSPLRSQ